MEQPARIYENDAIAIAWYPKRCIHAARCIAGLPDVFDPRRQPWVMLGDHTADDLAEIVQHCPSGALHFTRKDGGAQEAASDEAIVLAVPNGPLYVRGDVTIANESGTEIRQDTRMALCRCGHSENKPFCDNTHRRIGFRTEPEPENNQ